MKAAETMNDYIETGKIMTVTDDMLDMDIPNEAIRRRKKNYKYAEIGQDMGAAALLFAIHGQIVRDASGKVVQGTFRFPLGAEDAFDALYGEELNDSNSQLMESFINVDGKEKFRTVSQIKKVDAIPYICGPNIGYLNFERHAGKQSAFAF